MELRHLRYFIRAAELLHFTRAAESLYISQPSLSIHIQQLEDELKTKLFQRVGRNVHLTEPGQLLLTSARRAMEELESAGKQIEAMTGLLRGTLTLATLSLYGSRFLPPLISKFCLLHPNVHVLVRTGRAEDIEEGLLSGAFDLGFSFSPPEHAEFSQKHLISDDMVLVTAKDHPLTKKERILPEDLESVSMALPSHKISATRLLATYFEAIGISPNATVEQDDGHGLLELVKLGGFVTFLPRLVMKHDSELCLLTLPAPGISMSVAAMWTQLSPASTAFLELCIPEPSPLV